MTGVTGGKEAGKKRVLVSEPLSETGLAVLAKAGYPCDVKTGLSREELRAAIGGYDALVVRSATQVDRELLAAGKKLKVVGRAGVGLDNVDVKAATELGILVVNAPSGAPTLALTGGAKARLDAMIPAGHAARIHLTLTDDHPWAQAFVIIEAIPLPPAGAE